MSQLLTYAFASTLLGIVQPIQNVFVDSSSDFETVLKPLFSIDLGEPVGASYKIANASIYARDFSNSKVLVNPTYQSYSVDLDETYKTRDGSEISKIDVAPHTGEILLKVASGGDLNHDGVINVLNLTIFGMAFSSYPEHGRWNPEADLNKNGLIDILDGAILIRNRTR